MNIYIIDTELDTLTVHSLNQNDTCYAVGLVRGLLHVAQTSKGLSIKEDMEEYFTSEGCFQYFRYNNSPVYAILK
jgi:hypothetical protein